MPAKVRQTVPWGMDASRLHEAWKTFLEAWAAYREHLQTELTEAAREKDLARLTELNAQWRALRRLEAALQKVENLLPPLPL